MYRFGYPLWFVPIYGFGLSGGYCAKATAPGANITQYHKSSSSLTPALSHIGAIATFANGMQFMSIYQITHMLILLANRQFHTKPVWLFRFLFYHTINY